MATKKKIDTVQKYTQKLSQAKSVVLANTQGLTHLQLENLRKALKKIHSEMMITKNSLLKRALADNKQKISDEVLTGPTTALFAYEDEIAPLKELVKFFKDSGTGTLKAGLLEKEELDKDKLERLAQLPSKEVLLAKLIGQLQSPIYGLHYALSWNMKRLVWTLNNIKNQKIKVE